MEKKNKLKTYGYYVTNDKGVCLEWVSDAYTATKLANAKADTFRKTFYVYNCKTKTTKACYGYHIYQNSFNRGLNRFGYRW